jgi:uncharacterized protein YjbJ (UPF0337 family)
VAVLKERSRGATADPDLGLERSTIMGNKAKRARGVVEEIAGKLKKTAGRIVGSERVEVEGRAVELGGKSRQDAAKASERTKGAIQQVGGTVKKKLGQLIDNQQMELEGKAKELEGKARRKVSA